jgi:hypothetical protein
MACENGENMTGLKDIQKKIIAFRNARDWAQFHDPKNLAEALSIEAGELSCPVRSAINIHSTNEFMAATGPFWTSNGVKKTSSGRRPSSPAISPPKNSGT